MEEASINPCAPPFDQRSCCHAAMRFIGLKGFTTRYGSTAVLV